MYMNHIPELESARTYGILGIILQFVGVAADIFLHGFGFVISIAGLILLLLSIKAISNYYGNNKPFRYILYSIIASIVLGVATAIMILVLLIPVVQSISTSSNSSIAISILLSNIGIILIIIFLVMLAILIPIIFEYLAYNEVSNLTGINEFHTAALLLLIGIILTIIVIGIFLSIVGVIILIIAFNKLPDYAKPVRLDHSEEQDFNLEMN